MKRLSAVCVCVESKGESKLAKATRGNEKKERKRGLSKQKVTVWLRMLFIRCC